MNTDVSWVLDGGPALWLADGPAPRLPRGAEAVVQTSGTTGMTRHVMLSRNALRAAAGAARGRVGGDLTWHLVLPGRYTIGLMVQVRSAVAGRKAPVVPTDLEGLIPTGDGDAISLVPTQLHCVLGDAVVMQRLWAFDLILLGGAPLGAGLWERARDAGLAAVKSYGMSETSGGMVWDGKPLPGVWIGLCDGRVSTGGSTLFDGYLDDPAVTTEAMEEGTLLTHDRGHWEGGGLVIIGRVDDAVISGGVNVDLAEVRATTARINPETMVLAVLDAGWGTRVVLFAPGGDLTGWCEAPAGVLPRTWLPWQLVGTPIPCIPRGKPDRETLSGLIAGENHQHGPIVSFSTWVAGARPRTLPAAAAPILAGVAAGLGTTPAPSLWRLILLPLFCLGVALALQMGVNYANDYSDGIRSTDDTRVGLIRLTTSGLVRLGAAKRAAFLCFGAAAVLGSVTVVLSGHWWLLGVGIASILAAWYYTGGSRPYGYRGLGEVMVFLFFGLVATVGTTLATFDLAPPASWVAATGIRTLASTLLVVNNLRDPTADAEVGKRTLATRLGDSGTRIFFVTLLVAGAVSVLGVMALSMPWAGLGLLGFVLVLGPAARLLGGAIGYDLIAMLQATSLTELAMAAGLLLGAVIGR